MKDKKGIKIIVATGGTGGHICTALAIADELIERNVNVLLVGSQIGLEKKIISDKYRFKSTSQRPLLGKKLKAKLMFPIFLVMALVQAIKILVEEKPDGVIGTGGFGSFNCVFMASLLGIPTIISEIDSIPGLTTKVLSNFAYEIWAAFPCAKDHLPSKKVHIGGFPVRKEITMCTKNIKDFGLKENKITVFVFGGSRGAQAINKVMPKTIELLGKEFQFIWQTGTANTEGKSDNVYISNFINDMGSVYGNSDILISRSGALTIGEIMATGIPAILIPYPYATQQHQMKNAKLLEKRGFARIIPESKLTPEKLAQEIKTYILEKHKKTNVQKPEKASNAAKLIANRIIEIAQGNNFIRSSKEQTRTSIQN
ncbi:MAG: undecaprenyldiphospho-muramoylpentapeptide beta-N-acetylglucosaminyltransferase [bacterium]|nr:undecaprenyldiphospho-muramoylpentapeptide beta-N-acetylglucosaminyltransferase [bacterium]